MKRGLLTFALTLIMASGFSALAAVEHSPELWHVTHVTDPASGKFNYCAIESSFDNGLYLAFARNRDFNTNIVVSFPDKRLQDHSKYKMSVIIDANAPREMMGFAADATILVIPLQHDREVLGWLQKGKLLDLKGPQDSVKFALDGANDAFRKLQQCVEKSLKEETVQGATPSHVTADAADVAHVVAGGGDTVEPLPLPVGGVLELAAPAQPKLQQAAVEPAAPPAETVSPPVTVATQKPVEIAPPPAEPDVIVAKPAEPTMPEAEPVVAEAKPVEPTPPVQVAAAEPPVVQAPVQEPAPAPVAPQQTVMAEPEVSIPPAQPASSVVPVAVSPPEPQTFHPVVPDGLPVLPAMPTTEPVQQVAPVQAAPVKLSLPVLLAASSLKPDGKCGDRSSSCAWSSGQIQGSVTAMKSADSFLDAMMDDSDRREKQCKGQFSASIGAPMHRSGVTLAEASYACAREKGTSTDVMLYLETSDKVISVVTTATPQGQSPATELRDRIEASLPLATNYK